MATILLFHSILGLRPAEREIAASFEQDGHSVILPDLYGGETTNDYTDGFALKDRIGEREINRRAASAVAAAPEDVVLSGVSFGAFLIGQFWDDRPKSRGALFFAGGPSWMSPRRVGFPVAAHIARPDPFDDETVFEDWARTADGIALELHRYDGVGHYFLDRSLQDYDKAAANLCLERSRAFLNGL